MSRKKKKWMKFRHRVITEIVRWPMYFYSRWKYGVTIERFKGQTGRQYLILLNHQTVFDQFFVGLAFKGPLYYLATEDIFSNGWVSTLIRYLVAPIPIKKQATDVAAVINCMRVVKEGGSIALAPEGNRTYSGKTEYINPAIVPLVKKMKLPVALFRIEGGYGVQPRWSDTIRKGKMRAYVSRVIEPEEYSELTNEAVYSLICEGLNVNEGSVRGRFLDRKSAEYIERAMYVCPYCGLSVLESSGDIVRCTGCDRRIRYLPTKELEGVGFEFAFRFMTEWYDYQCDFVNQLDLSPYVEKPLYQDSARLSEVIVYQKKNILRQEARITLYGDRIIVDEGSERELRFPFEEISAVSVLGRNKLNIYHDKRIYQLKGDKRFNALKYVNIYYRSKNIDRGDGKGKFLGL